jgi:orotidine-5'-phosphate decarboxylase
MTSAAEFPYRHRLALALDVDDVVEAVQLASELQPWFGIAKVGLELFSSAGPEAISTLRNAGFEVFADLKLHDIPTTVYKAARVMGAVGARYLTRHAQTGAPMLRAGVEGLAEGALNAGLQPAPVALAVTVLTSDGDAPPHIVPNRVKAAVEAGCGGLVCAAADLAAASQYGHGLVKVVPGIRKAGAPAHDQAKAVTPREAFDLGADILVVGRAVTAAARPAAAAAELLGDLLTEVS